MVGRNVRPLRYWVQKILPLVYDDSLSYYELLNKVVYKLNECISSNDQIVEYVNGIEGEIDQLRIDVDKLLKGEFQDLVIKQIKEAIKHVYFGLTESGYFVAYMPEDWRELKFNTTEYDIIVPNTREYGHLTISY